MRDINALEALVKTYLSGDQKRINHVLGVKETAIKLAITHHEDTHKAAIAALYHDIMKNHKKKEQKSKLTNKEIKHFKDTPVMYHALSAAVVAKENGITDEDILDAIRYHVWGKSHMSTLGKIIFISDYCEPNREFIDNPFIFEMAIKDLDQAVAHCMKLTIDHVISQKQKPHPDQMKAYQYYKELLNEKIKSNY
jgi:predicted HD superfamily hydrolase involved in NAD metabolism